MVTRSPASTNTDNRNGSGFWASTRQSMASPTATLLVGHSPSSSTQVWYGSRGMQSISTAGCSARSGLTIETSTWSWSRRAGHGRSEGLPPTKSWKRLSRTLGPTTGAYGEGGHRRLPRGTGGQHTRGLREARIAKGVKPAIHFRQRGRSFRVRCVRAILETSSSQAWGSSARSGLAANPSGNRSPQARAALPNASGAFGSALARGQEVRRNRRLPTARRPGMVSHR